MQIVRCRVLLVLKRYAIIASYSFCKISLFTIFALARQVFNAKEYIVVRSVCACMCVCMCVCVYVCLHIDIHRQCPLTSKTCLFFSLTPPIVGGNKNALLKNALLK